MFIDLLQTRTAINVRQKIRQRGRILQLKQSHFMPQKPDYSSIPLSVLGSGYLRRLLIARTTRSVNLISKVDWSAFISGYRGVRWHPSGSWRVNFKKSNMHHNFFVNCSCYFKVREHGFQEAKRKAAAYRATLEREWFQASHFWSKLTEL